MRWLLSSKMDMVTKVQFLDEAVWISHSTNTFRKGGNPTILSPTVGQTGLFNFGMAASLREGKLLIQTS